MLKLTLGIAVSTAVFGLLFYWRKKRKKQPLATAKGEQMAYGVQVRQGSEMVPLSLTNHVRYITEVGSGFNTSTQSEINLPLSQSLSPQSKYVLIPPTLQGLEANAGFINNEWVKFYYRITGNRLTISKNPISTQYVVARVERNANGHKMASLNYLVVEYV